MIILFHCFAGLLYEWLRLKRYIATKSSAAINFTIVPSSPRPFAQRNCENDIRFDPSVANQRYERVNELLLNGKWRRNIGKIVEFGCATFCLFKFLKYSLRMREILFVDIDEDLLRDNTYRVSPLNADYIKRRSDPLTVRVYRGSVSQPDQVVADADVVIAIELIEHLYPDVFEAVPYNIFCYIRPQLAIITTPNSDFDAVFPGERTGFRHADHKFEWSREQFESWAHNITARFPSYAVFFDGIGLGPEGTESFGCCSQLAIFVRKDIICDNLTEVKTPCSCARAPAPCTNLTENQSLMLCPCACVRCTPKNSYGICTYFSYCAQLMSSGISGDGERPSNYKLLRESYYPVAEIDNRTPEEKILDEVQYKAHQHERVNSRFYNSDKDRVEIPLSHLTYGNNGQFITEPELRTLLLKFDFKIEECYIPETESVETCVIYEIKMETTGSGSDTEASGYESDNKCATPDEAQWSDWNDVEGAANVEVLEESEEACAGSSKTNKSELSLKAAINKKPPESLIDSGYQKSPLNDESPKTYLELFKEVATDPNLFDNSGGSTNLANKNNEKPNKLSNILSVFDKFSVDKVNELDTLRKDKKLYNFSPNISHKDKEAMRKLCQEIVKHPVAGPSNVVKKRTPKKSSSPDSEESAEDVKSITNCILENTLNKLELNEERELVDLIREVNEIEVDPQNEVVEPVMVVENGDLANNNRDREGNNYQAENEVEVEIVDEALIDNQDVNNVNVHNNNQILLIEEVQDVPQEEEEQVEEPAAAGIEVVAWSREALYDSNSQVDLLDDFEMDMEQIDGPITMPASFVIIAGNMDINDEAAPLLPTDDAFPNWLLQIFEEDEGPENLPDEPHFYCQGDGLGVHPSTANVNEEDEDEEEENDSESDSSSSTGGSVNLVNDENPTPGEDVTAEDQPPEDNVDANDLTIVGQAIESHELSVSSEQEEFYETAEELDASVGTGSSNLP